MNLSLRAKLFLLVGFAISLAALPIIYFSRDYLLESGMERERGSFVNTVMLVEDSLSVRYLHLLTSEVESVLDAKQKLRQDSAVIRQMLLEETPDAYVAELRRWQQVLADAGCRLAFYDEQKNPLLEDRLIGAALAEGQVDFKGQSMRSLLTPRSTMGDSIFALARVRPSARQEFPLLVCMTPVGGHGTVVLAIPVADTRSSLAQMEERMMQGMGERLKSLEMGSGSIAIISNDGRVIASQGRALALDRVPQDVLARVRGGDVLEGESAGKDGTPFLYRLGYFKALDWYVVAAVPMSAIVEPAEALAAHLFAVAGLLIVLSLLVTVLLAAHAIRPLRLLTQKAQALAAEDFSSGRGVGFTESLVAGLPVGQQDEVGQLAGAFAHMVKALDENIRHLVETLAVRQRMEGELNAAHDIQMGILPPPDSAPEAEGYHAAAFLEPAKEVGGDLYDFFAAPDGRQAIVIGDVSDKGVSAALFMSMTVTLVRYALADGLSCAEAMRRINERLAENNPSCMFVTLFIGLFDPHTGRLDYASGAHCPPFVVNSDAAVPVRALTDVSGPLVGAMEGMDYEDCHAELAPGEYCLLYTDGVSEAMDENKALFTEGRIVEVLDGLRDASPEDVLKGVMKAVKRHRGSAPQSDDITMLCFRRTVMPKA